MRPIIAVIIAGATLGLTPAAAQNADIAVNNEATATVPDANAVVPADNMGAPTPVDANAALPPETAPADTRAPQPAPARSTALPWGLLGLLGLVGLLGRRRSS